MTYCEEHGIPAHRFKPDKNAKEWDMLLGFHFLCKVCQHASIYIAHDKSQRLAT